METTIYRRPALSPNYVFKSGGDRHCFFKSCPSWSNLVTMSAAVVCKAAITERPTTDTTPGLRKSRSTSPPYRVLLHNDDVNKREYVVQVLMKVIPGMSLDNALNIMQEAHQNGMSVVIICAQPEAEDHCMQLRGNGLRSSIEPASGGC